MNKSLSLKNLWESLPFWARRALGEGLRVVPRRFLFGRSFRATLRHIAEVETWPAERLRDYQLRKLQDICQAAHARSPYYRETFDQAGFDPRRLSRLEDLAQLPLIDKHSVREHVEQMCTISPRSSGVDYVATGGSGGTPLGFYIGAGRSRIEYAYLVASWRRVGFRLDVPQAMFRGQIVAPDRSGLRHAYDPLLHRHYYSNFHMSDADVGRYLEHLRTIGPCFLNGYPSALSALTRFLRRSGTEAPRNVLGLLAGSENVYPEDRRAAEEVFGVRYLSWYGHSEKLVLAAECEASTDYHVWPTYGFCELIGDDGRRVTTPGQRGEIVGTGFINSVMPFIRYRTGDYATLVGDRCEACGRAHMILRDIRGHRTQEMLVAGDGSAFSWTAIAGNIHDDVFEGILQLQFRQERPGWATLRLVPAGTLDAAAVARIRRQLGAKLEGRLNVEVEICDEIPLTARGKSTYVDQRLPLDLGVESAAPGGIGPSSPASSLPRA